MATLSDQRIKDLQKFQKLYLKYEFKDLNLLNTSLTHSSYANESMTKKTKFNERLEFLGDSVLDLIVSEALFKKHIDYPEGKLTKIRSQLVCESSFAFASDQLSISDFLLLGRGEKLHGGKNKKSLKADAFEAVCAAIYLDAGYDFLYNFILENFGDKVKNLLSKNELFVDYKTRLQEYYNKNFKTILNYEITKEVGPDHDKTFYIEVKCKNRILAKGNGKSKKQAEQDAAKKALEKIVENA
ncbi:MAG: ribonuclease III [Tissierellia bacterium]|nr:ribonuclease III [Tissierellia bacterium]